MWGRKKGSMPPYSASIISDYFARTFTLFLEVLHCSLSLIFTINSPALQYLFPFSGVHAPPTHYQLACTSVSIPFLWCACSSNSLSTRLHLSIYSLPLVCMLLQLHERFGLILPLSLVKLLHSVETRICSIPGKM